MVDLLNEQLIERAKNGDKKAMAVIYRTLRAKVHRYLYFRVGDREAAEDLTTDVFLRVIENLHRYEPRQHPFQAWVFQIARNLVVDHFRRQKVRNHQVLEDHFEAQGTSPDHAVALSLNSERLQRALLELTETQCDVLVLRFVLDMPIAEVAHTLKRSESAVKSLQARGLASLARILMTRTVDYART
jgi:RNA polymerase sigma-70 factor (ECF subfamily)